MKRIPGVLAALFLVALIFGQSSIAGTMTLLGAGSAGSASGALTAFEQAMFTVANAKVSDTFGKEPSFVPSGASTFTLAVAVQDAATSLGSY